MVILSTVYNYHKVCIMVKSVTFLWVPIGPLASSVVIGTPSFLKISIKTAVGPNTPQSITVPDQSNIQAFSLPT